MARMRRILFHFLTLASLLICIGTIALWIRSYSGSDYISRRWMVAADSMSIRHESQSVEWTRGQIRFQLVHDSYYHRGTWDLFTLTSDSYRARWGRRRLGAKHIGWE